MLLIVLLNGLNPCAFCTAKTNINIDLVKPDSQNLKGLLLEPWSLSK